MFLLSYDNTLHKRANEQRSLNRKKKEKEGDMERKVKKEKKRKRKKELRAELRELVKLVEHERGKKKTRVPRGGKMIFRDTGGTRRRRCIGTRFFTANDANDNDGRKDRRWDQSRENPLPLRDISLTVD